MSQTRYCAHHELNETALSQRTLGKDCTAPLPRGGLPDSMCVRPLAVNWRTRGEESVSTKGNLNEMLLCSKQNDQHEESSTSTQIELGLEVIPAVDGKWPILTTILVLREERSRGRYNEDE